MRNNITCSRVKGTASGSRTWHTCSDPEVEEMHRVWAKLRPFMRVIPMVYGVNGVAPKIKDVDTGRLDLLRYDERLEKSGPWVCGFSNKRKDLIAVAWLPNREDLDMPTFADFLDVTRSDLKKKLDFSESI